MCKAGWPNSWSTGLGIRSALVASWSFFLGNPKFSWVSQPCISIVRMHSTDILRHKYFFLFNIFSRELCPKNTMTHQRGFTSETIKLLLWGNRKKRNTKYDKKDAERWYFKRILPYSKRLVSSIKYWANIILCSVQEIKAGTVIRRITLMQNQTLTITFQQKRIAAQVRSLVLGAANNGHLIK